MVGSPSAPRPLAGFKGWGGAPEGKGKEEGERRVENNNTLIVIISLV